MGLDSSVFRVSGPGGEPRVLVNEFRDWAVGPGDGKGETFQ